MTYVPIQILMIQLEQHNINVNVQDPEGNTPLHYATAASSLEAVKMLLLSSADVTICNKVGKRPLDYAEDDEIRSIIAGLCDFTKQVYRKIVKTNRLQIK